MGAHQSHAFEGCVKGAERFSSVVAREDTDVVFDLTEKLNQAPHWAWIHICVQVAELKDRESIKLRGNVLPLDVVVPYRDPFRVLLPAPVQPCQFEEGSNTSMDRIPVLRMKEVDALAKYLRLMIALDSEPLPRVHSAEAFLQPCKNVLLRQRPCLWHPVAPVPIVGRKLYRIGSHSC